jgi:hypothetical protein
MVSTCCSSTETQATCSPSYSQGIVDAKCEHKSPAQWIAQEGTTLDAYAWLVVSLGTARCTAKGDDRVRYEAVPVLTKGQSVLEEIQSKIFSRLAFPGHWAEEGVSQPNMACREKAFQICKQIFNVYERLPSRIAPTKEGGIFIAFDSLTGGRTLLIEVYNDLGAVYLVNDNVRRSIVASDEITDSTLRTAMRYV